MILPEKREEDLTIVELPEETLVYDLKRHRAYCLNRTVALIWRHCDGRTTAAELAVTMGEEVTSIGV